MIGTKSKFLTKSPKISICIKNILRTRNNLILEKRLLKKYVDHRDLMTLLSSLVIEFGLYLLFTPFLV